MTRNSCQPGGGGGGEGTGLLDEELEGGDELVELVELPGGGGMGAGSVRVGGGGGGLDGDGGGVDDGGEPPLGGVPPFGGVELPPPAGGLGGGELGSGGGLAGPAFGGGAEPFPAGGFPPGEACCSLRRASAAAASGWEASRPEADEWPGAAAASAAPSARGGWILERRRALAYVEWSGRDREGHSTDTVTSNFISPQKGGGLTAAAAK